ncbi:helix-turn-helix transcriptional regulator [Streptomyces sp. NPDC000070]|uniref:helix-turn-helix domain-containing protein n=1 Tax=Streptomyces sp. NPDC000070 TaxID=3154240 RepID=UPI003331D96D
MALEPPSPLVGASAALAEFLRELREKSGKTYDDLAKELNWSRSSIGNHLSGTVPTMDVVLNWSRPPPQSASSRR